MSDEIQRPKFLSSREKTVRLDSAPKTDIDEPDLNGGLLELFRAWLLREPQDRRSMPRHTTYDLRIWIGWCRDEQSFFATHARLVNISRGGALVHVSDAPAQGKLACVCLGEPEPKDCIEAKVLEVRSERTGGFSVRLAFSESCPHKFFEVAVCMLPAKSPNEEGNPSSKLDES